MKIAQIVSTFWPYLGGMGNVTRFFSQYLSARGHEVTVITPEYRKKNTAEGEESFPFEIQRIAPVLQYGNAAYLWGLGQYLCQYDILHLHYPFFGGVEPLFFYKLRPNQKLVITYHMEFIPSSFFLSLASRPERLLRGSVFDRASRVTVSSLDYIEHSGDRALYTQTPSKWIELPFGFDPQFDKALWTGGQKNRSQNPFVLFVGALDRAHQFKGLGVLLDAMCLLPREVHLRIVGEGDCRVLYEKEVLTLGLAERVRFCGRVSDTILGESYRDCLCLVLPSTGKGEAFGLVAVNAMAAGKPVIASNLPGVRTVVDPGVTGFLATPGDPKDLALRLSHLTDDPILAISMGEQGYRRAKEKYDWAHLALKLEGVYL